jgi:hypothetical protein
MQHSPSWEANSSSASQEIFGILWKTNVHYRIHNSQPFIPIMNFLLTVYQMFALFVSVEVVEMYRDDGAVWNVSRWWGCLKFALLIIILTPKITPSRWETKPLSTCAPTAVCTVTHWQLPGVAGQLLKLALL